MNNVAPNFEAGPNETLLPPVAGAFSRNDITFTDRGADVWSGTVNWGDGTESLSIDQAGKSFDLNHTYTADGVYTVVVTVNDDDGGSHTDSFEVTVRLNTPPVAHDDSVTVNEDTGDTVINVLANDTDEQDNIVPALTVLVPPTVVMGNLTNNGDGTFTYSPNGQFESLAAGESATESFVYQIEDSFGETATAEVAIVIVGVNDAPTVAAAAAAVTVDESQTAANSGTFADVDASDTVTIRASIGTVTQGAGTWSWSFPTSDGPDQGQVVTITATDSDGAATTTTFELVVNNSRPRRP